MPLDIPHLVAPRALPDGSVSWEEEKPEIGRRLREGDGRLNWLGDDRLTLVCNKTYEDPNPRKAGWPRWEVWRAHEQGEPTLVVWCVTQRIDGDQLLMQLSQHDTRTHDIGQEILDARDARAASNASRFRDENEDIADKLAWGLGRDLGSPAQSGRVFGTGQ